MWKDLRRQRRLCPTRPNRSADLEKEATGTPEKAVDYIDVYFDPL